ncbi:MAG: hypothetical protein JWP76_4854 [Dactylosporangium sp.]|nr:hypothetical protein [Dactylosporangium sp.]
MLAYVAMSAGAALIALATGLAFTGVLRAVTVGARPTVPPRRPTAPTRHPSPPPARLDDYGLLRTVVLVENVETGRSVRDLLTASGVRATTAKGTDGLIRVLVFPHEYEQARHMASWVL